jgi:hypothetical protein
VGMAMVFSSRGATGKEREETERAAAGVIRTPLVGPRALGRLLAPHGSLPARI